MPEEAEIRTVVRHLAAAILELEEVEVGDDADWYTELGGDSLQRLELISVLEERFNIRYPVESGAEMNTIDAIVESTKAQLR